MFDEVKRKKNIKELTEYKNKYEEMPNSIDELINTIKDNKYEKDYYITIKWEKNMVMIFLTF